MQNKTILTVLLALMFFLPSLAKADDEASALEKFNHSLQGADPRQVDAQFRLNHTNQPSKAEMESMMSSILADAMNAFDEATLFEKRFPESKQLGQVRGSLVEMLMRNFGSMGFPIPKNRASDVEAFIRSILSKTPDESRLYMVLVRVAQALPPAKAHDMFVELSSDSTPEPARAMAREGLVNLERLGLPIAMDFIALDGRHVNLSDWRGKVVLVDFWSTTCVPCVAETPGLKQLYEKYHTNGLEIVGISLDSDKTVLTRFLAKEKVPWPQYFDPAGETNRIALQYGVKALPVMWLVDKKGALRQLDARNDEEKKVAALLKE